MPYLRLFLVFYGLLIITKCCSATLRFANYYGNHMVLQMAPKKANVWGFAANIGDTVNVLLNGSMVATTQVMNRTDGGAGGMWSALLPAQPASGQVTIEARSREGSVKLSDVAFGDVWICSGQSNMYFAVSKLINYTEVVTQAMTVPNLRFMQMALRASNTTLTESPVVASWQSPRHDKHTSGFSALCLLYAMELAPHINRPIGLVETSWGGTPIEAWSSPDAMSTCQTHIGKRSPHQPSSLWNAMVDPLLPMTIYGVIWYQGEANTRHPDAYMCSFPAMINDWRNKFHVMSTGQTDQHFPFGFVQLAPNVNKTLHFGVPDLRWSQTAGYGYVPNPAMQNVFMAVAMDLPDYNSPYNAIHPRYKFDVAQRLALAGRAVAYGESGIDYQGPIPTKYTIQGHNFTIEFDHGNSAISIRTTDGFEVCCGHVQTDKCHYNHWTAAPIVGHHQTSVTIDTSGCHGTNNMVTSVRYEWEMSPCDFKMCAIYDQNTDLPAAPFTKHAPFNETKLLN